MTHQHRTRLIENREGPSLYSQVGAHVYGFVLAKNVAKAELASVCVRSLPDVYVAECAVSFVGDVFECERGVVETFETRCFLVLVRGSQVLIVTAYCLHNRLVIRSLISGLDSQ